MWGSTVAGLIEVVVIRRARLSRVGFYNVMILDYMRDHVEQELSVFDSNVELDAGWMHM